MSMYESATNQVEVFQVRQALRFATCEVRCGIIILLVLIKTKNTNDNFTLKAVFYESSEDRNEGANPLTNRSLYPLGLYIQTASFVS